MTHDRQYGKGHATHDEWLCTLRVSSMEFFYGETVSPRRGKAPRLDWAESPYILVGWVVSDDGARTA